MSKILELKEKRAKLWSEAKDLLDRQGGETMPAEDLAAYEKMEADIDALGRQIGALERQAEIDKQMSAATSEPIKNNPTENNVESKTGRGSEEYKKAFWNAMKNKYTYAVQDALQVGEDSEGGYLVPDEFERKLIDKLNDENIMRGLATVITSVSGDKKIPVVASHGAAAWTDEEGEFSESDDSFGVVTLGAHKLTSIIKVSEELLNDAAFNIEAYISAEFARRMAAAEEAAFIDGDGSSKPTGLLQSATDGVTAASGTAITSDEIIDLYHSLRAPYRRKAAFITNDSTIKAIRKLKDTTGQYLWQPGLKEGAPDTILNRPIYTSVYMPEIQSGNKIMAFGDMSYYWISDRQGRTFQRLNELFAVKGQVGFRIFQRVDGKLILPESVVTLKMGA